MAHGMEQSQLALVGKNKIHTYLLTTVVPLRALLKKKTGLACEISAYSFQDNIGRCYVVEPHATSFKALQQRKTGRRKWKM